MTPLRQNRFDGLTAGMIDAMQVRGFSVRTHESYLAAVTDLARYYHRPPDRLTPVLSVVEGVAEVQAFFLYPAKERHLSGRVAGRFDGLTAGCISTRCASSTCRCWNARRPMSSCTCPSARSASRNC